MPGFDDRLRRELGKVAEPAHPAGTFEKVMERKIRRRIARRLQVAALVVVVVAGTIGGTFALGKVFHSNRSVTPGGTGPTNGVIAFLSDRDFDPQVRQAIYSMRPDGTGLTRLTTDPMQSSSLSWSPDGTILAFTRFVSEGESEIDLISADGTDQRVLANLPPTYEVAWSQDGSKIAISAEGGNIYVMRSDGTDLIQLTYPPSLCGDEFPTWSPDGTSIAFLRFCNEQDVGIYVMIADGSNVKKLTDVRAIESGPAWSPDGTRIAFGSEGQIFVMDSNGTGRTQLTTTPENFFPVWSPDGTKIAFTSNRDGNREIYVMNADGSDQTNLTNSQWDDFAPAWQPVPLEPSGPPEPTPTPSETSSSPSPKPSEACSALQTTVTGDFEGDDVPDIVTIGPSDCFVVYGQEPRTGFSVHIEWKPSGEGIIAPLPECQSACGAFAGADLNADGIDELVILVDAGASTQFVEVYEPWHQNGEADFEGPSLVIESGAPGFPAGEPARFAIGGSVTHQDFMTCRNPEGGSPEVIATSGVLSQDQTMWNVHETVLTFARMIEPPFGAFTVVSTRDYTVPFDPTGETQLEPPGIPCWGQTIPGP